MPLDDFPSLAPNVKDQYQSDWRTLASMKGLRELRVFIYLLVVKEFVWRAQEIIIVEPLCWEEWDRLDKFDVVLPALREWFSPRLAARGRCTLLGREEARMSG